MPHVLVVGRVEEHLLHGEGDCDEVFGGHVLVGSLIVRENRAKHIEDEPHLAMGEFRTHI